MGRRWIATILFATGVGLSVIALAHHATAQIETPVPGLETPIPTIAPVVTAPSSTAPVPTLPAVNVGGLAAVGVFFMLFGLGLAVFFIACLWRVFTKAGEPGWAAIVPIYNWIVLLKIAGKPWWWIFILWLIIPAFIVYFDLARSFGKTTGFGIGLVLLPFIFLPILAFGDAQYQPHGGLQSEASGPSPASGT